MIIKKQTLNKIFEVLYWVFLGFLLLLAVLIIFSSFPIPGNYKLFLVESGSMKPAIKTGSVVVVRPRESYEVGEVISFRTSLREDVPTTHRIHKVEEVGGEKRFVTKGDANNAPDQRRIRKEEIIGKVLFSVPFIGYAVSAAQKPLGFMLIIVVPAAIIIFDELKNIWKEVKRLREEDKKDESVDKKQEKEIKRLKEKVKKLEGQNNE